MVATYINHFHIINGQIVQDDDLLSKYPAGPVTPEHDPNNIGGRTYKTVTIGNQIWFAENLDFKFSGLKIGTEVADSDEPYATYYNNDEATYGVNGNKYGLLYNWYAVDLLDKYKDQLIPGWHVPSRAEWTALATAVGGASVAGTKLKSKTGWISGYGTDDFGFAVFPTGFLYSGSFHFLGNYASFWTAEERTSTNGYGLYFDTGAGIHSYNDNKSNCYSIRLVRDA